MTNPFHLWYIFDCFTYVSIIKDVFLPLTCSHCILNWHIESTENESTFKAQHQFLRHLNPVSRVNVLTIGSQEELRSFGASEETRYPNCPEMWRPLCFCGLAVQLKARMLRRWAALWRVAQHFPRDAHLPQNGLLFMFNKPYFRVVTGAPYTMYFCTPTAIKNDELLEEKTEMETQSDGNQQHSGLQDFGCFNLAETYPYFTADSSVFWQRR